MSLINILKWIALAFSCLAFVILSQWVGIGGAKLIRSMLRIPDGLSTVETARLSLLYGIPLALVQGGPIGAASVILIRNFGRLKEIFRLNYGSPRFPENTNEDGKWLNGLLGKYFLKDKLVGSIRTNPSETSFYITRTQAVLGAVAFVVSLAIFWGFGAPTARQKGGQLSDSVNNSSAVIQCSQNAARLFHERHEVGNAYLEDGKVAVFSYVNHYNKKIDRCLLSDRTAYMQDNKFTGAYVELINVYENKINAIIFEDKTGKEIMCDLWGIGDKKVSLEDCKMVVDILMRE